MHTQWGNVPSLPCGQLWSNSIVIAQIRFNSSYGLSLLQIHFGWIPLLFGGHVSSAAHVIALTAANTKIT